MNIRWDKVAKDIKSFVQNPVTNLVKGSALVVIGVSEASRTFRDDLMHGHVRVGHGLIIIGLFSILESLPHLLEGIDAWARYLELREKDANPTEERGS